LSELIRHFWLPEGISTYSPRIDSLFTLIFWITAVVWVLVTATMIVFMVRYRARPGHKAAYIEGNPRLEVLWTSVTSVILIALALLSRSTWADIKEQGPPGDVFYRVTAKQFNWEITYPGPDGKLGTPDDVTVENEFHVPVNKVVRFDLTSRDVIHSFFVPWLRLKQDAVPGRHIHVWFEATKKGEYEIPCAQLCGFGHSGMDGTLYVQSEEDYQRWLKKKYAEGK
jgi:cytochrome c oxidase subunit II